MGLLSWLFPTDEDRLRKARALMADGRHEAARSRLVHCKLPEAEALYDECSAVLDVKDRATLKKRLAAEGFHGWKIEVTTKSTRRKAELESLIAKELERAGVDLGVPDVDQAAVKQAFTRAERKARGGGGSAATVRLVPIVDAARAKG